jgi:hypothetical protein
METTMTKIKDLVTVTVDNAFRNFPVDSERYELVEHVDFIADELLKGNWSRATSPTGSERIMFFTKTVQDTFALHAMCLARVQTEDPLDLGPVVMDRARRAKASMNPGDEVYDTLRDLEENVREYWVVLFDCFRDRLVKEHRLLGAYLAGRKSARNGVPQDMELQS